MVEAIDGTRHSPLRPAMTGGPKASEAVPGQSRDSADSIRNMLDPQSITRTLTRDMAAEPPVDMSKVEHLKAAITAGSYQVAPERIADAMIRQNLPGA